MKKLFTLMLSLMCVTAIMAQEALTPEADGYYHVGTAADLKAVIQADNEARIKLTSDIDASGIGQICDTFSGTIDGGHTGIADGKEVTLPYIISGKGSGDSWLFNKVVQAYFVNVAFNNFNISLDTSDNACYVGVIARFASNTLFKKIQILGSTVFCDDDYAGAVAGHAQYCTFTEVNVLGSNIYVNGIGAGGLVASSENSNYLGCVVNAGTKVYADGRLAPEDVAYAGGLIGTSTSDRIEACANFGWVCGECDEVGGIAAHTFGTNIYRCVNSGTVLQCHKADFEALFQDIMSRKDLNYYDKYSWITWTVGILVAAAVIVGLVVAWPAIVAAVGTGAALTVSFTISFAAIGELILGAINSIFVIPGFAGHDELGGIVGHAENGAIDQCSNNGYFCGVDKFVGGIVGWAKKMTINNCFNRHDPGQLEADTQRNPHYNGYTFEKTMDVDSYGTIVGHCESCRVNNCVSTSNYSCFGREKNIVDLDPASGNNFYWFDGDELADYPEPHCPYEEWLGSSEFRTGIISYRLNNTPDNLAAGIKPWRQSKVGQEGSLPSLDVEDGEVTMDSIKQHPTWANGEPYVVIATKPEDLKYFANKINYNKAVNTMCVLENDIDMTGSDFENWIPVGIDEVPFCGIFDGQGHTIKGLKVNVESSSTQGAGFFGVLGRYAIVENVTIEDSEIVSESNTRDGAAGVAGKVYIESDKKCGYALIRNCGNKANVTGSNNVGGVLGLVENNIDEHFKVQVLDCYNTGNITAVEGNSGLLCGYMSHNGIVKNCWSAGSLTSSTWDKPFDDTRTEPEYFVGYNDKLDMDNCYAFDVELNVKGADLNTKQQGVQNTINSVLTTGQLAWILNKETNDTTKTAWQQNLGTDEYPIPGHKGIYHSRALTRGKYGTICLPFTIDSDEKVALYQFSGVDSDETTIRLKFSKNGSGVAAAFPALYLALADDAEYTFNDNQFSALFEYPIQNVKSDGWKWNGSFSPLTFTGTDAESIYYVSNNAIRNARTINIPAFRAYFEGPNISTLNGTSLGSKTLVFSIEEEDGTVTSLQLVGDDLVPVQNNGKAYTIMGTEANKNYHGIVIKNGKKVVIK